MSRSIRGNKGPGYEYWSRRRGNGLNPCSENKRMIDRIERRTGKQKLKQLRDRGPDEWMEQKVQKSKYDVG